MVVRCLFEQSGTFKNQFIELGYQAYDYDIKNDFGKTDFIIDLFDEIKKSRWGVKTIFDTFSKDDLIIAFFPCIRFESQSVLLINGCHYGYKGKSDLEILQSSNKYHKELVDLYNLFSMFYMLCLIRGFKCIIENPYSELHYLRRYFPIKASIIDYDRRDRGDYFKKPSQYWFINCQPCNNIIWESQIAYDGIAPIVYANKNVKKFGCSVEVSRCLISPEYANRFIREFIIDSSTTT